MRMQIAHARQNALGRFAQAIRRHWILYALALPVMLYYILFHYLPMFGVVIAFQDYRVTRGILRSDWVGLENFWDFFQSIYAIYIISGIWQNVGWDSIIYMAAFAGIDAELYEAATVDGASRLRRIWHVTLPGIAPTITILLILRIGSLMSVGYEKIILLYNPTIYETADVISTYVYRRGLIDGEYSFATAVGLMNSVINFILLIAADRFSKRIGQRGLF